MTHTPTPWNARGLAIYKGNSLIAVMGQDDGIKFSEETSLANAVHIVKCVNMHDELVEGAYNAQQRILGVLRNHEAGESLNPAILRGALDALNAALAKASEEA